MQNFTQYTPTEIVFGRDTEKETGRLAKKWGAEKVLLVYGGGSVVKSGLLAAVERQLDEEGIVHTAVGGVQPNPRLDFAREAAKKAVSYGANLILAVGGGSVIDTAKAVAIGAANPDTDIWDIWTKAVPEPQKALPVGVVLTIAAAGSEMSDSAVLTNRETGKKLGFSSDLNRPVFAVMNPALLVTLPKEQIACGVVDILMHTLERYFTPVDGNLLTDEIAEGLMRTVTTQGVMAYRDSTDYDALSEVMWCGSLSHNRLTELGRMRDFTCHKLGHELGGRFDLPHGMTLSALWGSWARYVYRTDLARFARYGKQVWGIESADPEEAAPAAIERTEQFFRDLDMPTCFGELPIGIQTDEILKELADSATEGDTVRLGTFRPLDRDEALTVYRMANHGGLLLRGADAG